MPRRPLAGSSKLFSSRHVLPAYARPLSFPGTLRDTRGRVNNEEWNPAHVLILRKPRPPAMIRAWGAGEKERQIVHPALRNAEGHCLGYWRKERLLPHVGSTRRLLFSAEGSDCPFEVGWLACF
uniref:Uncharacterized protein n=1 Tax=Rousettus aegyptiacus TaxID=9407 RepID=A0A7J8C271_ROUAE|nr:hypothetical protein HJG63_009283 [Rousettus aegyptiacus]